MKEPHPPSARGNALFLILIAVALFAALSYAVTQSGRDGAGADKEQASIAAAQITQYGAAARAAVTRMVLTGTSVSALTFCTTGNANGVCTTNAAGNAAICDSGDANPEDCLFAAAGGGLPVQTVPDAGEEGSNPAIFFAEASGGWVVEGVGTNLAEVTMYNFVNQKTCEQINKSLGLSLPIQVDTDFLGLPDETLDGGYDGEPFQCFGRNALLDPQYIYLHVLVER